ncbi:MAG: GSU2204 family CXXCH-containing (seleno)protein [Thermoanaerobaculum sp.]|nr:GSU2204 family CXXCH-containing (seleno)protein [Thermoanaerobaculum sp.]
MKTLMKLFACSLVLLFPVALTAQVTGTVQIGGHSAVEKDNPARAAEYSTTESGPDAAVSLQYQGQGFFLAVESSALATDRQDHALTFELGRMVRSHTTFSKLPHRLVHDTLPNLAGSISDVKIVYGEDLDPTAQYGIRYDQLTNHTQFQFPGAGWLTLSTHFREQWRQGHVQSLSVAHCYNCHVVSQTRALDHHTKDAGISAAATVANFTIKATASSRDAREREGPPLRLYNRAQHPALRTPLFDDRATYDSRNGPLPYNWYPTQEKETYKLTVTNPNLAGFSLLFSAASSQLTNTHTGNEVEYDGLSLSFARKLSQRARLALFLRSYSFESTPYFYDSPEPVAAAGPYAGKTYRQQYGFDPDYLRLSALDRDVLEGTLRLSYKLGKGTTLLGQYQIRQLDRVHMEVAPGETTTLENQLRVQLTSRPTKGLNLRAALAFADISHPFMHLNAACNPNPMQTVAVPSPVVPGSVQYYQMYAARVADLTASPSRFWEARASASYQTPTSFLANLSVRWWDGENQDLDLTDWAKSVAGITASVGWIPGEEWQAHLGATLGRMQTKAFFCIPVMDG